MKIWLDPSLLPERWIDTLIKGTITCGCCSSMADSTRHKWAAINGLSSCFGLDELDAWQLSVFISISTLAAVPPVCTVLHTDWHYSLSSQEWREASPRSAEPMAGVASPGPNVTRTITCQRRPQLLGKFAVLRHALVQSAGLAGLLRGSASLRKLLSRGL